LIVCVKDLAEFMIPESVIETEKKKVQDYMIIFIRNELNVLKIKQKKENLLLRMLLNVMKNQSNIKNSWSRGPHLMN